MRVLQLDDIHHALERQLVKIKAVTDVIIGGDGLRIVVDHHGAVAVVTDGMKGLYAAPVELYGRTDTVGAGAQYDDGFLIALVMYVIGNAAIGEIQIIGLRRELTGKGVYLLHYRQDAQTLSVLAHLHHRLVHRHLLSESHSPCDLEIREA